MDLNYHFKDKGTTKPPISNKLPETDTLHDRSKKYNKYCRKIHDNIYGH